MLLADEYSMNLHFMTRPHSHTLTQRSLNQSSCRAHSSRVERVPRMAAGTKPVVVLAGRPATQRTLKAETGKGRASSLRVRDPRLRTICHPRLYKYAGVERPRICAEYCLTRYGLDCWW